MLIESHAPPYVVHKGLNAIIKVVDHYFYWPSLRRDVEQYVMTCLICQNVKYDRKKTPGLLQPLPILASPWILF